MATSKYDTPTSARSASNTPPQAQHRAAVERRRMVVMFCDMAGSTALLSRMDPEDFHALQLDCNDRIERIATLYGGFIAEQRGDGVIVCFGYPEPIDEAATEAVAAALAIQEEVAQSHQPYRLKIGIATGILATTPPERLGIERWKASGVAINLAARLQEQANAGQVWLTRGVASAAGERLETRTVGELQLKGLPEPTTAIEAIAWRQALPSEHTDTYSLIGRDNTLVLLREAWSNALAQGSGGTLLIEGAAGFGKSALLRHWLAHDMARVRVIHLSCSPAYKCGHFALLRTLLQQPSFLQARLELSANDAQAIAALVTPPDGNSEDLLTLPSETVRNEGFDALARLFTAATTRQLTCVVIDNLHWVDFASVEAVRFCVMQCSTAPMIVLASRHVDKNHWLHTSGFQEHMLAPLSEHHAKELIAQVSARHSTATSLPEATTAKIIASCAGVPLHLEQLTQIVLQNPDYLDSKATDIGLPPSIESTLNQRLTQLGPLRDIASKAAALGISFTSARLSRALDTPEDTLKPALDALVESEILVSSAATGRYHFRHALLQRAAHETLGIAVRRTLHGRLASLGRTEGMALFELAHHQQQAGEIAAAAETLCLAAKQAANVSSHTDAVALYERAIGVLDKGGLLTREKELEIRLASAGSMLAVRFYTDPELTQVWQRVMELASDSESPQLAGFAIYNSAMYLQIQSDWANCLRLMDDLEALADTLNSSTFRLMAHLGRVLALLNIGRFQDAHDNALAAAANIAESERHLFLKFNGSDLGTAALAWVAVTASMLELTPLANEYQSRTLSALDERDHPFTRIYCLGVLSYACLHQRDYAQGRSHALQAQALAQKIRLPGMDAYLSTFACVMNTALTERDFETAKASLALLEQAGTPAGLAVLWAVLAKNALIAGIIDRDSTQTLLEKAHKSAVDATPGALPWVFAIAYELSLGVGGLSVNECADAARSQATDDGATAVLRVLDQLG